MKKNDFLEIKNMDTKALLEKATLVREQIADLIMDKHMAKLKDTSVVKKKRKDLAQILTVVNQKELVASLEAETKEEVKTKKEAKA